MPEEQSNSKKESSGNIHGNESTLGGPLEELDTVARRRHVRLLVLLCTTFTPIILASVLTTKAVAATKVIGGNSLPLSL